MELVSACQFPITSLKLTKERLMWKVRKEKAPGSFLKFHTGTTNLTKSNSFKNILVVDDEIEMRIALETTLKREGHQIILAENGKQALEKLNEDSFDLVLTDVKMPKMNGVELLKALKKNRRKQ